MRFQHLVSSLILMLAGYSLLPAVAQGEVIVRMETSLGDIDIELYDQTAPISVTNFLNYVRRGDYDNSFIHRSAVAPQPHVIQGGGYVYENSTYSQVAADAPIVNEYSDDRPNTRGTIAMARTANPDSATSQWFFNISDNSATLNPLASGPYAVFGRVLGSNDDNITTNDGQSMQIVDAMASLDRFNGTGINSPYSAAFGEIPLIGYIPGELINPSLNLLFIHSVREINYLLRVTSQAGNTITLTVPTPATLANVVASTSPNRDGMPPGVQFTEGFFSFQVNDVTPGGGVMVAMELPVDYLPNTYYMYGPTPDNASPHWYEFNFNGQTGAEFFGNNYVVLHFIDGARGDADLTANGTITDPGAPGITTSSGSSGGGCVLSHGTRTTSIPLDFGLLVLIFLIQRTYRLKRS